MIYCALFWVIKQRLSEQINYLEACHRLSPALLHYYCKGPESFPSKIDVS